MNTGTYGFSIGETNRKRVFEFFQKNPCATNKDAAEKLGLSVYAVGRHAKSIRDGWRPEGHHDG